MGPNYLCTVILLEKWYSSILNNLQIKIEFYLIKYMRFGKGSSNLNIVEMVGKILAGSEDK